MLPAQFNIDIFTEIPRLLDINYEFYIPKSALNELKSISERGTLKERRAARIGIELSKSIKQLSLEGLNTDDAIVSLAGSDVIVCTNDRELKKRVQEKGGKVIFMRQKKFLEIAGGGVGLP